MDCNNNVNNNIIVLFQLNKISNWQFKTKTEENIEMAQTAAGGD